jgi:hypothetical protein
VNLDPAPNAAMLTDLQAARRDFPRYQIDVDLALDRRRFIARRTEPGPGPHTLITSDLTELLATLTPRAPAGEGGGSNRKDCPTLESPLACAYEDQ